MARNDKNTSIATIVYKQLRDKMMALEIEPGSRILEENIRKI